MQEDYADLVPKKPFKQEIGSATGATSSLPCLVAGIVCVTVMLMIFLPVIQQVREAARRADCSNRIRQMTLAAHNYHDAYKRLPTTICASGAIAKSEWENPSHQNYMWNQQHTSTLGLTHPFMEM